MLKQRNVFESTFFLSTIAYFLFAIVQYLTGSFGVWVPTCTVLLFFSSIFVSFRALQKLLELNAPFKYDEVFRDSKWQNFAQYLPLKSFYPKNPVQDEWKEYDTSELSIISTVLERKLVSSWYVPYISQDISFPFSCKETLDLMISKAFQISHKIDTPTLYTDVCSILLSHLKEYKRAIKLQQISNEGTFEQHYRLMHPVFSLQDGGKRNKCSANHCANILRVVMKELIPFELWDTPHSELLVRILTKRLDKFIKQTLSDPKWLNHKLIEILNKTSTKVEPIKKDNLEKTAPPKVESKKEPPEITVKTPEPDVTPPITTIESALTNLISKSTAPVLQNAIPEGNFDTEKVEKPSDLTEQTIDVQSSPILRQRRGRQGKSEVKIYDRIIEGSVKTWDTDVDLKCISMGQDLLASLDGEISLSRLWETDNAENGEGWSPNPPRNKSPPALWFGEDDTIDLEMDYSSPKQSNVRGETSNFSLPSIHNMKDLQSTVNQAKHKIGDLQDEAAGMMEGILDFGIAGLKKGLRLTGLHEGLQEKSHRTVPTTPVRDRSSNGRGSPVEFSSKLSVVENGHRRKTSSPALNHGSDDHSAAHSTNSFLVKQQRVASQDSVPRPIPGKADVGEAEGTEGQGRDSPEPEYEEAEDFASSIAKLRTLLQQRTADTPPKWAPEGMRWEGAEETRGRTQDSRHAHRPVDAATLADEYDLSTDRSPIPGVSANNMQRLDKLLQRTMTGVLNSIKTAVGGEGEEPGATGAETPPGDWQYVCTSLDLSVGGRVARLVASRRAHAVDAALDSLELTPPASTPPHDAPPPPPPVDLEEWCCGPGGCWSGAAELAAAAGLWSSHVTHTLITVLIADVAENVIRAWLRELSAWLRSQVFVAFEEMSRQETVATEEDNVEEVNVDNTCDAILDKIPGVWRLLLGEQTIRSALQLIVRSLCSSRVNADVAYRLLDVCALHATRAARTRALYSA